MSNLYRKDKTLSVIINQAAPPSRRNDKGMSDKENEIANLNLTFIRLFCLAKERSIFTNEHPGMQRPNLRE
jgi:hypothetical protein